MATYPNNILVKGNVINEVDVVDQNDHNILKEEIIALQTYVGTTPQGNRSNLMSRINAVMSGSGGFYLTNADPTGSVTYPGLYWYRTDTDTLKNIKTDGSVQSIGGSFSNTVFSYSLSMPLGTNNCGIIQGTGLFPSAKSKHYWYATGTAFGTIILARFTKFQGINTINATAIMWPDTNLGGRPQSRLTVGGVVGTATGITNQSTPTRFSFDSLNVSGLGVGSSYDVIVELRDAGTGSAMYLSSITGIGS